MLIIVHHHILLIQKITFSVLGEGTTEGINGNIATAEKKISISFRKINTKVLLSLHQNGDESYLYVNRI